MTIDYMRHRMREAFNTDLNSKDGQSGLRYTTIAVLTELGHDDYVIGSAAGRQTVAMVRKYQRRIAWPSSPLER
ncbi:MAG TPA: hypothetical protein VND94_08885 [Terriglobia bacterium]|nr:hypothetical protein [Terriglobia bacterium]